MAIASATRAQVETLRDEVYKLAVLAQKHAQGYHEQPQSAEYNTAFDAQVTATLAAVTAVDGAGA